MAAIAGSPAKSKARLPEDAPEMWKRLVEFANVLGFLRPSDITVFISSISKLVKHAGNMLLHYILGIAKYPFAVDILATAFSALPENFLAEDLLKACHQAIKQCASMNNDHQAGSVTQTKC